MIQTKGTYGWKSSRPCVTDCKRGEDGVYQVLVVNSTGQTWSLPNELSQYGMDDQGFPFLVEMPAD